MLTLDEEADRMGTLLMEFEKGNHEVIDLLIAKGMTDAVEAKVYCKKIVLPTNNDGEIVFTIPNTREHQDMLQNCKKEGQFFRLTNDGDVKSSSDMVLAHEWKRSKKVIKRLERERTAKCHYHDTIIPAAKKVFKKSYISWNGKETLTTIKYKQGPLPKEKI